MAHMIVTEEALTQTQNVDVSLLPKPAADNSVHATMRCLAGSVESYEIRRDKKSIEIGRHPSCDIVIKDKRASGRHVRIFRDDNFNYTVEELSANGAWCNETFMQKGEQRELKNGDSISICVHHKFESDSFAAWMFRLLEADKKDEEAMPAPSHTPRSSASTAASSEASKDSSTLNLVTEQWIQENWSMRTVLGSGNFSEVRMGLQVKQLGSAPYAVKIIDKRRFYQFQSKRVSGLSLQDEAKLLMDMHHPNIINFFSWFETEEKLYIAMEYVAGGDLLQFIMENGAFQEQVARRLFGQITNAVGYLHSRNIVHRDLKPENILLSSKNVDIMEPKLADFGLARMNMKTQDCKTFCGTPHYFAPEVIKTFQGAAEGNAGGYGKQVDMWSLGVILYIILSGIPPFEEEGLYEQILAGKYEFDVQEWTKVSAEAKELVAGLMVVDPKLRFNIERTMQHKWFVVDQKLPEDPTKGDVRPMEFDSPDVSAKRRRTMEDADAGVAVFVGGA
uniref:Serine/threonine-protein kinase Chk2 n=1 Tax=Crypthecodinium cohnii TaxID=2866 RepID=A0A516AGM1_CRYCO|nr:serine/threonine-protein kinase Chk2 [Crypthecodinium cohnii]USW07785.1 serine/threonine-protein kinase Chk2 [Crypthecodinium cohnii]